MRGWRGRAWACWRGRGRSVVGTAGSGVSYVGGHDAERGWRGGWGLGRGEDDSDDQGMANIEGIKRQGARLTARRKKGPRRTYRSRSCGRQDGNLRGVEIDMATGLRLVECGPNELGEVRGHLDWRHRVEAQGVVVSTDALPFRRATLMRLKLESSLHPCYDVSGEGIKFRGNVSNGPAYIADDPIARTTVCDRDAYTTAVALSYSHRVCTFFSQRSCADRSHQPLAIFRADQRRLVPRARPGARSRQRTAQTRQQGDQ